jgi:cytochrome c-type biogenesis protein CcmF
MVGIVGQLLLLVALGACALAGVAYVVAARSEEDADARLLGRVGWSVSVGAALAAAGLLAYLFLAHQFQYAYVYQNSSKDLPAYFLFSSFWAGQEGSFLLWIVLNGAVGAGLIRWAGRRWEAPVMAVVAGCQFFLLTMIAGVHIGGLQIGASPFLPLAEKFPDAPIFQANPDFIPADGTGLNELLQNYWMVIHPPTLFAGFASMIAPFAFAVAALWKKRYTQWVRPALPFMLFGCLVLGVGIAMGGYWAYETLSFGGYWAWDPVENSSLVPWIVGIAALHAMLIQKKSGRAHKAALGLSIASYLLVVYSTFLTRSGVLGDISVHSFVDLGLHNQLLLWMGAMIVVGFGMMAWRYRDLPAPKRESNVLSREFLIFSGAMLLCATAAVIILGTSAPIFGRIFRDSPSGVPTEFYNKWTLPLSVGLVFLAGMGQLFWWNKMSVERVSRVLMKPLGLAVASTVGVLLFTPFLERTVRVSAAPQQAPMAEAGLLGAGSFSQFWAVYGQSLLLMLLVFAAFFALYGNGIVMWRVGRGNPRMAGGALTHVGFALVVLGIVASSGFNNTLGSRTLQGEERDNFVLTKNEPRRIEGYEMRYTGKEQAGDGKTAYVVQVRDPKGRSYTLRPVAYKEGEQWFQRPDIQHYVEQDLYAAASPAARFEEDKKNKNDSDKPGGELTLSQGDSTTLGREAFALSFEGFDTQVRPSLVPDSAEVAVAARIELTKLATNETRDLRPVYIIMQDRSVQYVQNRVRDWGLTLSFTGMNVDTGAINLAVEGVKVAPEDWIVMQAREKPFIGVLWAGILILAGGFAVALVRRARELRLSRERR